MKLREYISDAMSFCRRNLWLAFFSFVFVVFTSLTVFSSGPGGIWYSLFALSLLMAFIFFFRLGCRERALFDVEDMISCIFKVLFMTLHIYMRENVRYEVTNRQAYKTMGYRLLLAIAFASLAVLFETLMEETTREPGRLYIGLMAVYVIGTLAFNLIFVAFLERRYRRLYGGEDAA